MNGTADASRSDLGQKNAAIQVKFMPTKSILLAVTDPQALDDIHQVLGAEWEVTSVPGEAEALVQLDQRSFDAFLVDFNLGSPDASELLNQTLEKRPETSRFLLAYEADLALVAAKVLGSHQILPKPIEPASLKSRIENGVNESKADESGSDTKAEVGPLPEVPSVYSEVLSALESPEVTVQHVGEMIASDAELTTEVLTLTRSTHLSLPRNINDPVEAVESLGLEVVKALVMARRFLAEHSHLKPGYLSLEKLWLHSIRVAQIARDLVLFETKDRTLASQALAAGLLHDLGKVVLATNFDDLYGRVHSLARKQPVALWDVEKEMFGANHGEIGACLVGMWNMPSCIVEAAAFHHEPPLGEHEQLTPLAAVHIANVLEHQLRPRDEFRVAPIINAAFLNELGLLQRLPVWRATSGNRGTESQQFHIEPADAEQTGTVTPVLDSTVASRTANHFPGPATETRTTTSGQPGEDSTAPPPASRPWHRRWVYAGAAVAALLLLAFWLRTQSDFDDSAPVYARTPAAGQANNPAPAIESFASSPEDVSSAPVEVPPTTAVSEAAPGTNVSSVANPPTSPEPVPVIAVQVTPTNVPPAALPTKPSVTPDFRLSGIIYTVGRPSAILNGKTVYVGDRINGAIVLRIGQTDVTLQVNGKRWTYDLP